MIEVAFNRFEALAASFGPLKQEEEKFGEADAGINRGGSRATSAGTGGIESRYARQGSGRGRLRLDLEEVIAPLDT